MNQEKWEKVVDYTKYDCRSWQDLYFKPRAVRYIRVIGTLNTVHHYDFHLITLEAMYKTILPELACGLIRPTYNVATNKLAKVIDGEYRENLFNEDLTDMAWHPMETGRSITVQLNQPYVVDSLRMKFSRTYSFYVLTSYDKRNWDIVVDKRNIALQSWQNFTFNPRPVVYIKFVETENTNNNVCSFLLNI